MDEQITVQGTEKPKREPPKTVGYNPERYDPKQLSVQPLWHRQKGESWKAYEAFMTYLMLEKTERTMPKAAAILGKSTQLLRNWSSQWRWAERVAAYEEHYLLLKLESHEATRDRMWAEQNVVASLGMDIVRTKLMEITSPESNESIKPDALVRLFAESAKIQRMSVLGRLEGQRDAAEQAEKLTQRYADELVELLAAFMNDLGLTPEQQKKAQAILGDYMTR